MGELTRTNEEQEFQDPYQSGHHGLTHNLDTLELRGNGFPFLLLFSVGATVLGGRISASGLVVQFTFSPTVVVHIGRGRMQCVDSFGVRIGQAKRRKGSMSHHLRWTPVTVAVCDFSLSWDDSWPRATAVPQAPT
jgi:hypothetical protein